MLAGELGRGPWRSGVCREPAVVGLASVAPTTVQAPARRPTPAILDSATVTAGGADGAATALRSAPGLGATLVALAPVIGAASLGSALQHRCLGGGNDRVRPL
jgi:hypothetical protein